MHKHILLTIHGLLQHLSAVDGFRDEQIQIRIDDQCSIIHECLGQHTAERQTEA